MQYINIYDLMRQNGIINFRGHIAQNKKNKYYYCSKCTKTRITRGDLIPVCKQCKQQMNIFIEKKMRLIPIKIGDKNE